MQDNGEDSNSDDESGIEMANLNGHELELHPDYKESITKVRKICQLMGKSRLQNDRLRKYVVEEIGSRKKLKIDCWTRWNSMLHMLKRYWKNYLPEEVDRSSRSMLSFLLFIL